MFATGERRLTRLSIKCPCKLIVLPFLAFTVLQCTQCTNGPRSIAKANEGRIEGSVFLITNAGDLKPARFAKVRVWQGVHNIYHFRVGVHYKHLNSKHYADMT